MIRLKNFKGNIVLKVAILLFAVLCIATVVRLQLKTNDLKSDAAELQTRIDAEEEKVRELRSKLDAPFDEDYVIGLAKEKLHLRLPDEVIFYNDN